VNVTVTDVLPAGLDVVGVGSGGVNTGGTITWTVNNVAFGTPRTVTVTVRVNAAAEGTILNTATATSTACSNAGSDCSDDDEDTVDYLAVGDYVWEDTDRNGIQDSGELGIAGVQVCLFSDSNNNGVYVAGVDTAVGACVTTDANGEYHFDRGILSGGRYFVVIPSSQFAPGAVLAEFAPTVKGATPIDNNVADDSNGNALGINGVVTDAFTMTAGDEPEDAGLTNNTIDFGFTPIPPAAITITKDDGRTEVLPGQQTTYMIIVTNTVEFSRPVTNLTISDTLPTNVTFVEASPGGAENAGVVTWTIPSVAYGTPVVVTVTVEVNDDVTEDDTVENTVVAVAPPLCTPGPGTPECDDTTVCDLLGSDCAASDIDDVVLPPPPDPVIDITKTDGVTTVKPGDTITYNIVVSNVMNGSNPIASADIFDQIPANLTLVDFTTGGTYDPSTGTVSWNVANLAYGAPVTFTITATVNGDAEGTVVNTATVDSDVCDNAGSNCDDTDTDTVLNDNPPVVPEPPNTASIGFKEIFVETGILSLVSLMIVALSMTLLITERVRTNVLK
jgi:uncharacterized repeat protein (TIGR01451 family)/fimbrial isopeptide formation D2 family protein